MHGSKLDVQTMSKKAFHLSLLVGFGLAYMGVANSAVITYSSRAAFLGVVGTSITDDYSAAGYQAGDDLDLPYADIHSNAHMSSVLGETRYQSTGFNDLNIIAEITYGVVGYCAGCNGSFLLDFTSTSIGTSTGVYGVGLDFYNADPQTPYSAFVTYGDGTTQNFALPLNPSGVPLSMNFFGLTVDQAIRSMHIGLANGGATMDGAFGMDNLTIAAAKSLPEPETLGLLALAAALLGFSRLRRSQQS